jgi:hypothetical protein
MYPASTSSLEHERTEEVWQPAGNDDDSRPSISSDEGGSHPSTAAPTPFGPWIEQPSIGPEVGWPPGQRRSRGKALVASRRFGGGQSSDNSGQLVQWQRRHRGTHLLRATESTASCSPLPLPSSFLARRYPSSPPRFGARRGGREVSARRLGEEGGGIHRR